VIGVGSGEVFGRIFFSAQFMNTFSFLNFCPAQIFFSFHSLLSPHPTLPQTPSLSLYYYLNGSREIELIKFIIPASQHNLHAVQNIPAKIYRATIIRCIGI